MDLVLLTRISSIGIRRCISTTFNLPKFDHYLSKMNDGAHCYAFDNKDHRFFTRCHYFYRNRRCQAVNTLTIRVMGHGHP